jgi:hypothetical protein
MDQRIVKEINDEYWFYYKLNLDSATRTREQVELWQSIQDYINSSILDDDLEYWFDGYDRLIQ